MAASTAMVTSDVYSVPEVASDAASLHDPHDVDALERLLDDERERRRFADRAHERAMQFTWDDAAGETAGVYRSVLHGTQSTPSE